MFCFNILANPFAAIGVLAPDLFSSPPSFFLFNKPANKLVPAVGVLAGAVLFSPPTVFFYFNRPANAFVAGGFTDFLSIFNCYK